jgi:hypothetical protein
LVYFHRASFISTLLPERQALNKIKFAFYKSTKRVKNQYNFSKNSEQNKPQAAVRMPPPACRVEKVEKGESKENFK